MQTKHNNTALISLLKQKTIIREKIEQNQATVIKLPELALSEVVFFHVEELTFEDESPRRESLENVLSTLTIPGIQLVYLLIGDQKGVSFYFGIAKESDYPDELPLDVDDIGRYILKPSIEGNFRGSKITEQAENKQQLFESLKNMKRIQRLDGVPAVHTDNENFQGVDRLVDVMMGDSFALLVLANSLTTQTLDGIENDLHQIYNTLSPLAKESVQTSEGQTTTTGTNKGWSNSKTEGTNSGNSKSTTDGTSKGETHGTSDGMAKGTSEGEALGSNKGTSITNNESDSSGTEGTSKTKNTGTSHTINTGTSHTTNTGSSNSISISTNTGKSTSITQGDSGGDTTSETVNSGTNKSREFADKLVNEWMEYIDEILLKRIEHGHNKGLFNACIYLLANEQGTLLKLGNTMKALFSGVEENRAPLKLSQIKHDAERANLQNLQLSPLQTGLSDNLKQAGLLFSKNAAQRASWISTHELSVIMGLPQKEVVGLALKEEVEFGLNVKKQSLAEKDKLLLGHLVRSGGRLNVEVHVDKNQLNKHTFVTGVTGSGKTSTCLRLLDSADLPFLVIEPAKTEYRILTQTKNDILIFTLGDDSIAPFRLNPFEFFKGENISARVDMIKATLEAAFDMDAAIPQLIEAALYQCYELYGWDVSSTTNDQFRDPFSDGVFAFPTLQDLIKQVEVVAEQQGFGERLQKDYIGSMKARLQSLLIGAKGSMLNTPRSIDFMQLVERNVILELEEIKNGGEKSLIMGFVLINLNEAIKQKYKEYKKQQKEFKHITLIEEAHRLLSKHSPGDNPNKKLAVETFADMLAEVRKYGESLVIVDQIPDKLTPEVLKNTNMKIVHKLFASDDKNAIGNTMALNDEQKQFLSNLETGQAIISSQDFAKPLRVQIQEVAGLSTTTTDLSDEATLRNIALCYYQQHYKKGLIPGLELHDSEPSLTEIERFLTLNVAGLLKSWEKLYSKEAIQAASKEEALQFDLKQYLTQHKFTMPDKLKLVVYYLTNRFYKNDTKLPENYLKLFISDILSGNKTRFSREEKSKLKIR